MARKFEWQPIPGSKTAQQLPGGRGSYALLLGKDFLPGQPRFVHFSWQGEQWILRDFIEGRMLKKGSTGISAEDIWAMAKDRKALVGRYRKPVTDTEFWRTVLSELTEKAVVDG